MKISELIAQLQDRMNLIGDVNIFVPVYQTQWKEIARSHFHVVCAHADMQDKSVWLELSDTKKMESE